MIIQYDPTTGKIMQIVSGNDSFWTDEVIQDWNTNNPSSIALKKPDGMTSREVFSKLVNLNSLDFMDIQTLSISVDKTQVTALGTETVTFSNVPEGTSIESDYFQTSPITMDSSQTLEIDFEDPGNYRFTFKASGFDWFVQDIVVN